MSFFVIVVAVLSLMYGYIGWRIITPAAFGLPVTLLLWALLIGLLALPFVSVSMRMHGNVNPWADVVVWTAYLTFGFLTLLFALLVAKDLVFVIVTLVQKSTQVVGNLLGWDTGLSDAVDPERRRLLANTLNLGLLGVTGALTGYGMFEAMRTPRVVELDIPITGLPPDLDGFTIVQISDIHASATVKRPFIQAVVDRVNELRPDLVALTGDLVDGSVEQLRDDVVPLADLKAPEGLFFITGNHDYYSGVEPWLEEVRRLGFTVLLNEHRVIERGAGRLLLAGVTDFSGGQFSPEHRTDPHKAISGAPMCHAKVLLAHQPKSIYEAAKAGYDYVLSGHTHGGQYFPYHFLAAMAQPFISGLHQMGGTRIYVSRGTGYWGPQIRIGAPSEITVHRLISA